MGFIKDVWKKAVAEYEKLGLGHAEEFNEEIDLVSTTIDESKYDLVDLARVKPDVVAEINRQMTGTEALSKKVVLNDFILQLCDSAGELVRFRVHCYDKKSRTITANDGKRYRRFIDLYQLDDGKVVNICQVVMLQNKFPLRYHMRRVGIVSVSGKRIKTNHIEAIERHESLENIGRQSLLRRRVARFADPEWEQRTQYALYHYWFVLHQMVNCPERFVEAGNGTCKVFNGMNEVKKARTVIKPVHTTTESPTESVGEGHVITCPYWTVRGHYRTLKSGKKVWVKSYAKGKNRHDPDQIVAKTYDVS